MPSSGTPAITRRRFVQAAATGTAAIATGMTMVSCDGLTGQPDWTDRTLLPVPPGMGPTGTLIAAPGTFTPRNGPASAAWMINGSVPSPTIRVRRGDLVQLQLVNQLPQSTILHWHGLVVPADADGHPRDAVLSGGQYAYAFPIVQRAGTYWYHPHAHHHTAEQVHRGMAGFFIVVDDEEDALELPGAAREILLLLQDRNAATASPFDIDALPNDDHTGMLRTVAYGNGVALPAAYLSPGRSRLRIVNGSHARVYRLALDNGLPLLVIGNDGGLLPSAVSAESTWLGVGERVDCLIDTGAWADGTRVMLQSLPFELPGDALLSSTQGMAMDLLQLIRLPGQATMGPSLPMSLSSVPPLAAPVATRTFVFTSGAGGAHRINGSAYDITRSDVQLPLGAVERWVFQNDSDVPHPVHLHGTQFQVQTRSGGRNVVFPYERGWKDTVLVMPTETVDVLVQFDVYAGTYLLHCHNLQHEDRGMMLNIDVQ